MAAPRKVFRIEESAAAQWPRRGGAPAPEDRASPVENAQVESLPAEILQAFDTLHATMAATAPKRGADGQRLGIDATHLTRIARELAAVVSGTAQATQRILAAAEEIDQAADNLSAALKGRLEQDVAQDLRDLVVRIFEACNFQDLIGQRVTKVMATLQLIEDHIARLILDTKHAPEASAAAENKQYLHGPRLDSDRGHLTQSEIDAMFEDS